MVPANQIHDFNPGVDPFPDGLFWTMPIPRHSVRADLEDKTASLRLTNTAIDDYGNVANALSGGKDTGSATINLELEWKGGMRTSYSNPAHQFRGNFVRGTSTATLQWSATMPGFSFDSGEAHSEFAQIGQQSNGRFFAEDDEEDD